MKNFTLIFLLLAFTISFGQSTKKDFIAAMPMDSCMMYNGGSSLIDGTCYIIKFTGNGQSFLNELAKFHIQDEGKTERSEAELFIKETTKPYWVYGTYSVDARLFPETTHVRIEIVFKAYSNPANYTMYGAEAAYQKIVNSILARK